MWRNGEINISLFASADLLPLLGVPVYGLKDLFVKPLIATPACQSRL